MTVAEFYEKTGGGYEEMIEKFHSDALIARFLKMFENDNNFNDLCIQLNEGNAERAFAAVHNVKGLVLNLNIMGMIGHVNTVTEALRAGDVEAARAAFPQLKQAYDAVKSALAQI